MIGYVFDPFNDKLVYAEYRHAVLDGLSSILVGQSHPNKMFWLTSMNYDPITGNMLTFHYNGVSILDSTLYQVAYHDRLKILTSDNGDVMRVGDNYFTHGARDSSWQDGRRRMVLHKYDTAFTILKADTLGWHVWDNFPFIVKSMDIQDSTILIGGNLDGPFNGGDFFTRKKKFYLAKYNLTLDQIWYKEYGGDLAYILNGLELLSTGSSVAYGFISDTLTNIRYSYLLYVDENGDIISSLEVPSSTIGPHLDVVNPGDDRMTILNPDGLDAHILVYTINGKMVINTSLQPDKTSLDLSAWPAGMYPYVFYLDDKPVKSGKWVKKE